MSIADQVLDQVKANITDIENREDLTNNEKVSQIIKLFAAVCAGLAAQPIPFADIIVLTPIQAYMGTRIAAIRGVPVSKSGATTIIKEIAGVVGLGLLAQQLVIGAYKTVIPFLGAFTTIPLVFGFTYGIGRVMDAYFLAKSKRQHLSPEAMKNIWQTAYKEGKKATDKDAARNFAEKFKKAVADPAVRFVRTNLDEVAIIGSLELIRDHAELGDVDHAVLAALTRTTPSVHSTEDAQTYLGDLHPEQINGVVSNVKGVLHEMEFVRLENADGDNVSAAMFEETNHPGYDVILTDNITGDVWEVQLKATDNRSYVDEWIDTHPDGEILVTEEIAEEMGLPSSGASNEELTARVADFVDAILSGDNAETLWLLFPGLSALSVAFVVIELRQRYLLSELSAQEFKIKAARATGIKVVKIGTILALMSVPGVNVAVGAALITKMIMTVDKA